MIPIKIRAHHLLCIQGYQGHGYSQDFEENMGRMVEKFRINPTLPVMVVCETDAICEYCPHQSAGRCTNTTLNHEQISKMDFLVLEKLNLVSGATIGINKLISLTKKLNKTDVVEICDGCSWRECCLWFQDK
ncbi:MAG: DUF1284 domain-containing protein [Euryarchaeota archaeon]|jgi:hypothetical protein|nr:DUF1284 domain-containing protein [Euryarchaeota archaeon]